MMPDNSNQATKKFYAWFITRRVRSIYVCEWDTLLSSLPNSNIEQITVAFGHIFDQQKRVEVVNRQHLSNIAHIINNSSQLSTVNMYIDAVVDDFLHFIRRLRPDGPIIPNLAFQIQNFPTLEESKELLQLVQSNFNLGVIKGLKDWKERPYLNSIHSQEYHEIKTYGLLNKYGRRYIQNFRQDRETGVQVLSHVIHHVDALYLHLLENPELCNIDI